LTHTTSIPKTKALVSRPNTADIKAYNKKFQVFLIGLYSKLQAVTSSQLLNKQTNNVCGCGYKCLHSHCI